MLLAARAQAGTVTLGDTVAAIVEAHRSGASSPEDTIARSYARIRAHDDPAIFITLRDEADARRRGAALAAKAARTLPLYGIPFAVKDNIDVAGIADHRRLPGLRLHAGQGRHRASRGCARPARSSSARPISTSSPPAWSACARPTACRATLFDPTLIPGGSSSGSAVAVARRPRAARARHRHRRLRPRAGRAQQHRRPEAEPRPRLDRRRGAGLPHARLRLGVRADRRRRLDRARRDRRPGCRRSLLAAAPARTRRAGARRAAASACRSPGQRAVLRRPGIGRGIYEAAIARFAGARRARSSRSTSSRSTRRRACSTKGPWVAERYLAAQIADRLVARSRSIR